MGLRIFKLDDSLVYKALLANVTPSGVVVCEPSDDRNVGADAPGRSDEVARTRYASAAAVS